MSLNPVISMLGRRLRLAVVGGGPGSFIGAMHRQAARLDDRYEIVAGVLSSDPERALRAATAIGIDPDRAYGAAIEMLESASLVDDREAEVLLRSVLNLFDQYVKLNKKVPPEILASLSSIDDPGRLADTIAAHLAIKIPEKQELLDSEQEKVRKENQRKLDERKDKLEAAAKRVRELNARFADWYYVISEDVYKKIHLSRSDIIKESDKARDEGFGIVRDRLAQAPLGHLDPSVVHRASGHPLGREPPEHDGVRPAGGPGRRAVQTICIGGTSSNPQRRLLR